MDRRSAHAAVQLNQLAQLHFDPTSTDPGIDGEAHGDIAALTVASEQLPGSMGGRTRRQTDICRA